MPPHDEEMGAPAPGNEPVPAGPGQDSAVPADPQSTPPAEPETPPPSDPYSYQYDSSGNYEDPYAPGPQPASTSLTEASVLPATLPSAAPPALPPPPGGTDDDDDPGPDERGMLRMSFLEHLEELRSRILRAIAGMAVAYCVCLTFAEWLYRIVSAPASAALTELGIDPPELVQLSPMEGFTVVWLKLPLLAAIFLASPWVLYQVWAFIAPGLYKKERRWAAPFVISAAGLFIVGGLFAYFVAFRFGLTFLLGIGRDIGIRPLVSVEKYFDLFVNVMLGIGIVFELPVIIFFLTLLRIASPRFLVRNSRYAILAIVIIAAIVTPTPDVFNLMLFSVPMVALFFLGVFASYILVLHRERKRFPWALFLGVIGVPILLVAAGISVAVLKYGFKLVPYWPFLVR